MARHTVTEFKDLFFLFFHFHPSKLTGQPPRATLASLFHCSQRNQKLTPADAGPKTNALRPLLDRYETPLHCAATSGNATKDKPSDCIDPFGNKLRVSPASATSVSVLYTQQKMCHWECRCQVFSFFLPWSTRQTREMSSKTHMRCEQSFIDKPGT